jgi:hypothetical protein
MATLRQEFQRHGSGISFAVIILINEKSESAAGTERVGFEEIVRRFLSPPYSSLPSAAAPGKIDATHLDRSVLKNLQETKNWPGCIRCLFLRRFVDKTRSSG